MANNYKPCDTSNAALCADTAYFVRQYLAKQISFTQGIASNVPQLSSEMSLDADYLLEMDQQWRYYD